MFNLGYVVEARVYGTNKDHPCEPSPEKMLINSSTQTALEQAERKGVYSACTVSACWMTRESTCIQDYEQNAGVCLYSTHWVTTDSTLSTTMLKLHH